MDEFLDGVCSGVKKDAVGTGKAEDADREVFGQQFIQANTYKIIERHIAIMIKSFGIFAKYVVFNNLSMSKKGDINRTINRKIWKDNWKKVILDIFAFWGSAASIIGLVIVLFQLYGDGFR
jgi:hypothetical protein